MANDSTEREDFDHGEPNPPPWRRRNTRIEKRRAFGPCRTRKDWELRRCVTVGAGALEPPDEAVNILAAADPGEAEPFPPDVPFCSDGIVPTRAECGRVRRCGQAGPEPSSGQLVVIFGVVVTFGVHRRDALGSVVVTFGSVVVTLRQRRRDLRQRRRDLRQRRRDASAASS